MKWWKSVSLSLVSLFIVILTGLVSLVQAQVIRSDAASSPVFTTAESANNLTYTNKSFAEAQTQLQAQGIRLDTTPHINLSYVSYTAVDTSDTDLLKASYMLAQEWIKYTPELLQKSGLKKIYLVKNLTVNTQQRSGMPEPMYEDALYFDVSPDYITSENGMYMRRTYHHEFRHLMDYNSSGSYAARDLAWESCHDKTFKYGKGGSAMYADPDYAHKKHPVAGFVDGYATSGIEEDKAQVYAYLMTGPETLQKLASEDPQIDCKLTQTRLFIKNL